ncbi:hypothetical protein [Pumilibacter intestinalis]|uniref:hypothetical protein n=1 Tax=Pumilibacter intestinalis TaxID=2941511 RepID=UPI00203D6B05|nr:hypothetical protein [Pumilibacter intestinalis]MCI8487277.1 hypothetical protein [Clostridia bacterium]
MLNAVKKIIFTVAPFALPVIVGIVCAIVGGVLIAVTVRQIRRQVKLYNSITLVELKSFKWHYFVFIFVAAFFVFYVITQMADYAAPEVNVMSENLNMQRWQVNLTLAFMLYLLLAVEFLLIVLARSKSAVVDKGIYSGMRYLDWYHVHDYIIDEERGHVILSSDKYTFFTLRGTTPPLKVAKNDIPKLKFILNKNKNKFSE